MRFRIVWLGSDDESEPQQLPVDDSVPSRSRLPFRYEKLSSAMVRRERLAEGHSKIIPLTTFSATVVADRILDDGHQPSRSFLIEAEVGGQKMQVEVAASEFARMGWVLDRLGPAAIIYPGQQQHARAAIQSLSGPIRQERIFAHLGWRQLGTDWVYLHAGGALGSQGARSDVPVQVSAPLQHYQVALPTDAADQRGAVRASLQLLSVAPDRITVPLLAGVYRAALGRVDFSLFLAGPSGSFKTALAALCQQHFGAAMDASLLPGGFTSTANALEGLALAAQDALLVVDDFVPTGGAGDGALQSIAERLFRGAGNYQGRNRTNGQGRLQEPRSPRGLILATGEEVPCGQSLRARLLIIEVAGGDVAREGLSQSQNAGTNGRLSQAMGAFLQWMAGHYEEIQKGHRERTMELRNRGYSGIAHHRFAAAVAQLQSAWEIWLEFIAQTGTIGIAEHSELAQRGVRALGELVVRQSAYQPHSDPALRFLALLRSALESGGAHLADRRGNVPAEPRRWGWRPKPAGGDWIPQGVRIGWIWNNDVFLEPTLSYQLAQRLAGKQRLAVSEQTLRHRMREGGLLASIDSGRQMLVVRRTVEGCPRQLLHLSASDLGGKAKW